MLRPLPRRGNGAGRQSIRRVEALATHERRGAAEREVECPRRIGRFGRQGVRG